MKKRVLSMVLAVAMVVSMITMQASAATVVFKETTSDDITWTVTSDGTLTVSGKGDMECSWLEFIDSESVDEFEFEEMVTKIVITSGITSISESAFRGLSEVTSVSIPDTVTSIGAYAFSGAGMKSITIPSSVTSIGVLAFWGCSSLTSIELSYGLTELGYGFLEMTGVTSITIPESVTTIGAGAFSCAFNLKTIVIPASVTTIEAGAFMFCNSLSKIIFEGSLPDIASADEWGDEVFAYVEATVYYPADDSTWTADAMQNYGGTLTWKGYKFAGSFTDVTSLPGVWYYNSVIWAVDNSITSGTSATTFSPTKTCTRAEIVTFLWNLAGKPEPTTTENPFTDVSSSSWYYKAVMWAVENNITAGTTATTFSPTKTCTRCEAVQFLYSYAGKPSASSSSTFTDVSSSAWYAKSVNWAVANGITSGTGNNQFSPTKTCTRAEIVTFLYNYAG